MTLRKFKLTGRIDEKAKPRTEGQPKPADTADARHRIQLALNELNEFNTKAEIEDALSRGVQFSLEGITKKLRVGTDTLRKTNSDLFDILKHRILKLEQIAGRPLRGQAAKTNPKDKPASGARRKREKEEWAKSELEKANDEILRLEKLLANAEETILDLTARLSVALQVSTN